MNREKFTSKKLQRVKISLHVCNFTKAVVESFSKSCIIIQYLSLLIVNMLRTFSEQLHAIT